MTDTTAPAATDVVDPYCGRTPQQIPDLVQLAKLEGTTPDALAREDGTFNRREGTFACDECYMRLGAPSAPGGWVAKGRGAL